MMNAKQLKKDILILLNESLYDPNNKSRQTSLEGKIAYERLWEYVNSKENLGGKR